MELLWIIKRGADNNINSSNNDNNMIFYQVGEDIEKEKRAGLAC